MGRSEVWLLRSATDKKQRPERRGVMRKTSLLAVLIVVMLILTSGYQILSSDAKAIVEMKSEASLQQGKILILSYQSPVEQPAIRGLNSELWALDPDTGNRTSLPDSVWNADKTITISLHDPCTSWSKDGGKVAHLQGDDSGVHGIFIINRENFAGTHIKFKQPANRVNYCSLSWSPDGTKIAFNSFWPDNALHVVDINSGKVNRILQDAEVDDFAWSPDSTRIVCSGNIEYGRSGLFVIDSDGGNREYLSSHGGRDVAWSPDGSEIAFINYTEDLSVQSLSVLNLTDGQVMELFASPDIHIAKVIWSPDGTQIAFSSYKGVRIGTGANEIYGSIYVVNSDGSNLRTLVREDDIYTAIPWMAQLESLPEEMRNSVITQNQLMAWVEVSPSFGMPVAEFAFSSNSPKTGEEIILDARKSYGSDGGEILMYGWDLGDRYCSTTSPIIFYYWRQPSPEEGYEVKLEVVDDGGLTGEKTRNITVSEKRWDFWSWWSETWDGAEMEIEELDKIYRELDIEEYLRSCGTDEESSFFVDLLKVAAILNKPILNEHMLYKDVDTENESGFTYRSYVMNVIQDMKAVDSINLNAWTGSEVADAYFKDMAEINGWAKGTELATEALWECAHKSLGRHSPWLGPILQIPDICQAGIGLRFLDDIYYRGAFWFYFWSRHEGYSASQAWNMTPLSGTYRDPSVRGRLEKLYDTYSSHMASDGIGLDGQFREDVKEHLRTILFLAYQKYKCEPLYEQVNVSSPVELQVYDCYGNVTGLRDGEVKQEIPNSRYDGETETVVIFSPVDFYRYLVIGKKEGSYDFETTEVFGGQSHSFNANDMTISRGEVHQYTIDWGELSQGEKGATLQIDSDGDGNFEQILELPAMEQGEESFPWLWIALGGVIVLVVALVGWRRLARKKR